MDRREDYLKVIFRMASEGEPVTAGRIADQLGVSSPSVSAMARRLERDLFLERKASGWQLTRAGELMAVGVVRRHRLVETFLVEVLGMSWDEVHAEAEALEHAVSPQLEKRIDALLGYPTRDPHGDPIPPVDGPHDEKAGIPLTSAPDWCLFQVDRISDRDSAVLRHLAGLGIVPGVVLEVQNQEPFGGPRWVRLGETAIALGPVISRSLRGSVTTATSPHLPPER